MVVPAFPTELTSVKVSFTPSSRTLKFEVLKPVTGDPFEVMTVT
jgi:hypothetical protein